MSRPMKGKKRLKLILFIDNSPVKNPFWIFILFSYNEITRNFENVKKNQIIKVYKNKKIENKLNEAKSGPARTPKAGQGEVLVRERPISNPLRCHP